MLINFHHIRSLTLISCGLAGDVRHAGSTLVDMQGPKLIGDIITGCAIIFGQEKITQ
jgi:hypothetical protein